MFLLSSKFHFTSFGVIYPGFPATGLGILHLPSSSKLSSDLAASSFITIIQYSLVEFHSCILNLIFLGDS